MKHEEFEAILGAQLQRVRDVFGPKTSEYARPDDQLNNFRKSATILGCSIPEAVAGMMVKHTVSVYDMVTSGQPFPEEKWDEKITDHINYLILLKAALVEGAQNPIKE